MHVLYRSLIMARGSNPLSLLFPEVFVRTSRDKCLQVLKHESAPNEEVSESAVKALVW